MDRHHWLVCILLPLVWSISLRQVDSARLLRAVSQKNTLPWYAILPPIGMPQMSDAGIPNLFNFTMPASPPSAPPPPSFSFPKLPLPPLPSMSFPPLSQPKLPSFPPLSQPKLPSFPPFSLPSFPPFSLPKLPPISLPSAPPTPSMPMKSPGFFSLPTLPQLPGLGLGSPPPPSSPSFPWSSPPPSFPWTTPTSSPPPPSSPSFPWTTPSGSPPPSFPWTTPSGSPPPSFPWTTPSSSPPPSFPWTIPSSSPPPSFPWTTPSSSPPPSLPWNTPSPPAFTIPTIPVIPAIPLIPTIPTTPTTPSLPWNTPAPPATPTFPWNSPSPPATPSFPWLSSPPPTGPTLPWLTTPAPPSVVGSTLPPFGIPPGGPLFPNGIQFTFSNFTNTWLPEAGVKVTWASTISVELSLQLLAQAILKPITLIIQQFDKSGPASWGWKNGLTDSKLGADVGATCTTLGKDGFPEKGLIVVQSPIDNTADTAITWFTVLFSGWSKDTPFNATLDHTPGTFGGFVTNATSPNLKSFCSHPGTLNRVASKQGLQYGLN